MATPIPPFARSVIAVSAGVFVGGLAIYAVELLGHALLPSPAGVDVTNPAAVKGAMNTLPTAQYVPLLLAYFVGPTTGAWIAARMAPSNPLRHAAIVGGIFLVGALMNFRAIPHPTWFVALAVLAFAAAPFLGARLARR